MKKLHISLRLVSIGLLFAAICAAYLVSLVRLQITGQDYYGIIREETRTRYVTVTAKRGEIYDRNGKALVINTAA